MIDVEHVRKSFEGGRIQALVDVTFHVATGELVALTGPSGGGKSTLLNLVGALDRPDAGEIVVAGLDVAHLANPARYRALTVGFVFQFHNLIPVLTTLENVQLPLLTSGVKTSQAEERAKILLGQVGLSDRLNHLPDELSGGEQQRVAIARALANHPRILLADEPTGDLDTKTGTEVVQLMYDMAKQENATVMVVTHDPVVAKRAERVFEMRDGILTETSSLGASLHTIRAVEQLPPEPENTLSQPN